MMLFNTLKVGDLPLSNNDQPATFSETYSRQTFHMKMSIFKVFQIFFFKCQIYLVQVFKPALVESTSEEIFALTEGLHINAAQGNSPKVIELKVMSVTWSCGPLTLLLLPQMEV